MIEAAEKEKIKAEKIKQNFREALKLQLDAKALPPPFQLLGTVHFDDS